MLPVALRILAVAVLGYLLGGVPFGAIVSRRAYGVDITKLGSGNTGATNVLRNLGWKAAVVVAVCDIVKGALPAIAARLIADPAWGLAGSDLLVIAAGVSAILGHMYSPYFGLRGGKGVATAAGAIIVLMPLAFPFLLVVFAGTIALTRIVSLASVLAALSFPVIIWWAYPDRQVLLVFAVAAVPLVLWAHRANIRRLVRGEEPRIRVGRRGGPAKGPGATGKGPDE